MATDNYIVIHNGVNRSSQAQVDVMIWIRKEIKHANIKYTNWSERITEVIYAPEGRKVEKNLKLL
jgi:hypothetical protein